MSESKEEHQRRLDEAAQESVDNAMDRLIDVFPDEVLDYVKRNTNVTSPWFPEEEEASYEIEWN